MPSIITHDIFAKRVYEKIINDYPILEKSKKLYQTFAQSHDYLFYYKSLNIKKTKHLNLLGHIGHWEKTQDYLINIIEYIKDNKLENNSDALAYIYGSITHYVLDSNCHPLIFYKTGTYHKEDKSTYKYKGEHAHMERDVDAYYYEQTYNRSYKYCNVARDVIGHPYISDDLTNMISAIYKKTYNEDNIGEYYKKSINKARRIYSVVINDRFGVKRFFYKGWDFITRHHFGYLSSYSTHITDINMSYLNLDHKEWNHPCFKDLKFNYSFEDLMNISEKKCIEIIKEIDKYLNNKISLDKLKESIPNISYSTGLEIDKNKRMKYFEY
jgi:hypothetical protein